MTTLSWSLFFGVLNVAALMLTVWKVLWLIRFIRRQIDSYKAKWGDRYIASILVFLGIIEGDDET